MSPGFEARCFEVLRPGTRLAPLQGHDRGEALGVYNFRQLTACKHVVINAFQDELMLLWVRLLSITDLEMGLAVISHAFSAAAI